MTWYTAGGPDIAAVIAVWPHLVARARELAGPVRHHLLQQATPAAVHGWTIHIAADHPERLRGDHDFTATVERIAYELLRHRFAINWVTTDQEVTP